LHIVYGTLAALYSREQTGLGQRVDVNLFNSLLTFITQEMSLLLNGGSPPQRSASGIPNPYTGAPYRIYQTGDGYIAIGMNPLNKLARLLGVTGYDDIASDNVMENRDTICNDLAKAFIMRPTDEWLKILLAEDIWCAPVFKLTDLENDPQIAENQMITTYEHPTIGTVRGLGIPVKFSETPGAVRRPAPLRGEHTADLLKEFGGYTDDEIATFVESGVFG
jgi:crotonobetainyl-CoA:carnitine CoA-transferase CaiB-like acyl-CoA transferase